MSIISLTNVLNLLSNETGLNPLGVPYELAVAIALIIQSSPDKRLASVKRFSNRLSGPTAYPDCRFWPFSHFDLRFGRFGPIFHILTFFLKFGRFKLTFSHSIYTLACQNGHFQPLIRTATTNSQPLIRTVLVHKGSVKWVFQPLIRTNRLSGHRLRGLDCNPLGSCLIGSDLLSVYRLYSWLTWPT